MRKKLSAVSHQRSEAGFTLTELLITMVVFVLAIAAASQMFTDFNQFKQQSRTETNIEGLSTRNVKAGHWTCRIRGAVDIFSSCAWIYRGS